jgi:hypothetical protein
MFSVLRLALLVAAIAALSTAAGPAAGHSLPEQKATTRSGLDLSAARAAFSASAAPWDDDDGNPARFDPVTQPDSTTDTDSTTATDWTTQTAAAPPQSTYDGPTVLAPTTDQAPSITLYGPEVLRVSARRPLLRLVVFSSGAGTLDAKLGGMALGTRPLRMGGNDVRYPIARKALRSFAARGGTLTLTSLSPAGDAGSTLTRRLRLSK